MQITDPIADLLTRIRNASPAKHPSVEIPASNMKKAICQILVCLLYTSYKAQPQRPYYLCCRGTAEFSTGKKP